MPDQVVSPFLTLPADTSASGFYVTNAWNNFTGNVAIGGWSGFAFPILPTPIGLSRYSTTPASPMTVPTAIFDGNVAHSSGFWWGLGAMSHSMLLSRLDLNPKLVVLQLGASISVAFCSILLRIQRR